MTSGFSFTRRRVVGRLSVLGGGTRATGRPSPRAKLYTGHAPRSGGQDFTQGQLLRHWRDACKFPGGEQTVTLVCVWCQREGRAQPADDAAAIVGICPDHANRFLS